MLTFEEWVLCGNPLQWFGSGLEPDPELTREFGPIAHTTKHSGKNDIFFGNVAGTLGNYSYYLSFDDF